MYNIATTYIYIYIYIVKRRNEQTLLNYYHNFFCHQFQICPYCPLFMHFSLSKI